MTPDANTPREDGANPAQPDNSQPTPQGGGGKPPAQPDAAPEQPGNALPAEVERELAAAMDDLAEATDAHAPKKAIRGPRVIEGGREHRHGRVVSVGDSDVFVEFGPKELGIVARTQWPSDEGLPKTGDNIEVVVNRFEPNESLFLCSLPGAVTKAEWEMLEPGQVVEARVTGHNKGGLELEIAGHRAFMPASQIDVHRIEDLSVFNGEKLACRVQRIDRRGQGNIVLSRRDVLREERKAQADKLKEQLKEGDVREGTVRKLMPFGAFVDIGGVDGLVHVSDMSHERIHKPEQVVKEGQTVSVKILKLDWAANRISLGMKQTQEDPFKVASDQLAEGATVPGRVTKLMEFGAFVEVAPGVEGLVHISELDWKRTEKVEHAVKPDQVVNVKILSIDPDSRRVALSIKQTTEPPADSRAGRDAGRSADDIQKETPALRRMREEFKKKQAKLEKKGKKKVKGGGIDDGSISLSDLKF